MNTLLPFCKRGQQRVLSIGLTFFFAFFFLGAGMLQAQLTTSFLEGGIIINEVLPDPNSSGPNFDTDGSGSAETEDEFIEFVNVKGSAVDISGWEVYDDAALHFTFPANTIVPAGGYVVLINAIQSGGSLDNIPGDFVFEAGGSLSNTDDGVMLYNPNSGERIEFLYNGQAGFGTTPTSTLIGSTETANDSDGLSMSRATDASVTWVNQTPTPGFNNEHIMREFEFVITEDINSLEEDLDEAGFLDVGSSDLELGSENTEGGDDQRVGLRFTSLLMPQGSTIQNAFIQFTVDATNKNLDPCVQTIFVEDVTNSAEFGTSTDELTGRTDATSTVSWTIPEGTWTEAGQSNDDTKTPDISELVQLIVDKNDWSIGNAMSFFFEGTGRREAEAQGSQGPKLVVKVTGPADEFLEVGNDIESIIFEAANNAALSDDVVGQIREGQIVAYFPIGTDISDLTPTIVASTAATVEPATGVAQDLSGGVNYTVTAEAGFKQGYTLVPSFAIIGTEFNSDPFNEGWTTFSAIGDNATWIFEDSDNWVSMNPFGSSADNCLADDWLFSPVIDMDAFDGEVLTLTVDENFGGTDLELYVSTDYTPGNDPSLSNFTLLDTYTGDGTFTYDVSGVTGNAVIAFRYNDPTDGSCSEWRVVDFVMSVPESFTLQLLHYADVDSNEEIALEAVENFSALVDHFQNDPTYANNTLTVHSGDIIIPGPRYFAAEDPSVRGITGSNEPGNTDVYWSNLFGVQAGAVGNHELDFGPGDFHDGAFVSESNNGNDFLGSDYPWLSVNIDFSPEGDFTGFIGDDGDNVLNLRNQVAKSAVIYVGGQPIGLVGVSTPTLPGITSTGDLGITPVSGVDATPAEIAALIQPEVDALIANGVNKVVLLAHMQSISVEKALAEALSGVDIIVAGGSNTRMGQTDGGNTTWTNGVTTDPAFTEAYPFTATSAASEPVAVVNVDADFKYLGRLVVDFNADGTLDLSSIDPAESNAWSSTDANVTAFSATPIAEVVALRDAIDGVIAATFGNVVGYSDVFLEGRRSEVRTQETNLGSLSAKANLWYANLLESGNTTPETVDISIKNGGGIRAEIGNVIIPAGSTDPDAIMLEAPSNGEVSQGSLNGVFRFNNGLTRLTLTNQQIYDVLEHAVGDVENTGGRFPQIAGVSIEYDPTQAAGSRITKITVTGKDDDLTDVIFEDGAVVNPTNTYNIVTLDFLATGGDGYPFPDVSDVAVDYFEYEIDDDGAEDPANQSFAATGSEQDAIAEYFEVFHPTPGDAFSQKDTPKLLDPRIQDINETFVVDADAPTFTDAVTVTALSTFAVPGGAAQFDESSAEIPAYWTDGTDSKVFFTDSNLGVVHVLDMNKVGNPTLLNSITLTGDPNSVAVFGDVIAVATEADPKQDPGKVEFFSAIDYSSLGTVTVGALPDMVTFNEDGTKVLTANEGEPSDDYTNDPLGTVSVVTLNTSDYSASTVQTLDFTAFDSAIPEGVRVFGGSDKGIGDQATGNVAALSADIEPEYITVEGDVAYVTCQENNALAIIDISTATASIVDLLALGTQDHFMAGNGIDPTNREDLAQIVQVPVKGFYMPDAIASYVVNNTTYLVTANEGDAREYIYEDNAGNEIDAFIGEARIGDLAFDPSVLPLRWQDNELLGRLKTPLTDGDIDDDGLYEELYSYGTRSFTIWNGSTGEVVWDSKNALEQLTKQRLPDFFNATNDENNFDNRSDDKGPEPEGVTIGMIGSTVYAFVGLERVGGIVGYDITDPTAPTFAFYVNNRDFTVDFDPDVITDEELAATGDLGPEGLVFVPAASSPNGENLLVVTNEVSGTVTTFQIGGTLNSAPTVASPVADRTEKEGFGSFTIDLGSVFSDSDALTYEVASGTEATATIAFTGTTATVTEVAVGTTEISLTATDTDGFSVSDSFLLTVVANQAPTVASAVEDRTETIGFTPFTVDLNTVFDDADTEDVLTFTAASSSDAVATAVLDATTGVVTVTGVAVGSADITLTATDGIAAAVTDEFTLTIEAEPLGIDDLQGLSIYPVPAASEITITHDRLRIEQVNIISVEGKLIRSGKLVDSKLDISDLESGSYILELIDEIEDETLRVRIIKQ